eukprot:2672343-Alexandrium_andersonii.AAC.1
MAWAPCQKDRTSEASGAPPTPRVSERAHEGAERAPLAPEVGDHCRDQRGRAARLLVPPALALLGVLDRAAQVASARPLQGRIHRI